VSLSEAALIASQPDLIRSQILNSLTDDQWVDLAWMLAATAEPCRANAPQARQVLCQSCASERNFRSVNLKDQLRFSPQFTNSKLFDRVINFAQTDRRGRCSLSAAKQMHTFDLKRLAACTCGSTTSCRILKGPTGGILDHDHRSVLFGAGPQVDPRPGVFPFKRRC
jgi:hypothetical protein